MKSEPDVLSIDQQIKAWEKGDWYKEDAEWQWWCDATVIIKDVLKLTLKHISEPTRRRGI